MVQGRREIIEEGRRERRGNINDVDSQRKRGKFKKNWNEMNVGWNGMTRLGVFEGNFTSSRL